MAHTDIPRPPVAPVRWKPPKNPGLKGPYRKNQALAASELWPVPDTGPEDVVLTEDGTLYTGTSDGSILKVTEEGNRIERVAHTGGRPLGVELLGDGRLLVCDADEGLLAVDPSSGDVERLVVSVDGERLRCTNNAAVAPDGTIWFTDSSRRFPVHHYKGDILEHIGTGRLIRRDPDGTLETVLDGLHFANGVALDPDGGFVLVAETGMYRIQRHWLTGRTRWDHRGVRGDAGLPGQPVDRPDRDVLVCRGIQPKQVAGHTAATEPAIRKAVWKLPDSLQPDPAKQAIVIGYDASGNVTHNLQWHKGEFIVATGAREHDGWLYVGSLESAAILRHRLSPAQA
jgi:DNA-binding beta-propeller fold protein YncE